MITNDIWNAWIHQAAGTYAFLDWQWIDKPAPVIKSTTILASLVSSNTSAEPVWIVQVDGIADHGVGFSSPTEQKLIVAVTRGSNGFPVTGEITGDIPNHYPWSFPFCFFCEVCGQEWAPSSGLGEALGWKKKYCPNGCTGPLRDVTERGFSVKIEMSAIVFPEAEGCILFEEMGADHLSQCFPRSTAGARRAASWVKHFTWVRELCNKINNMVQYPNGAYCSSVTMDIKDHKFVFYDWSSKITKTFRLTLDGMADAEQWLENGHIIHYPDAFPDDYDY